jgi:predicted dehydrogenase
MEKNTNRTGDNSALNRREFLRGSSLAGVMGLLGGVQLIAPKDARAVDVDSLVSFTVKVGVIGLGMRGREIVASLAQQKEAIVAAVCDSYPAYLRRGAKAAPDAKSVGDYRAVLDDKDIKAVVIATPTHQHKDIALAALQAGKHVYCEAPLANTVDDARAIAKAALAAKKQYVQVGLTSRSHPQSQFMYPFVRAGAMGRTIKARSQWQKKQSWRLTSPNPDREKEINWRLDKDVSPGLAGEIGVHQFDIMGWYLGVRPTAVSGYGQVMFWKDGRTVPDTIQALIEYEGGVTLNYDCTLANSFEGQYDVLYGTDAAVMMRNNKAWMFKEVDAPLLGWEVYARKDVFFNETGIALMANASKQKALTAKGDEESGITETDLSYALKSFLFNVNEISAGVEDFLSLYDATDLKALDKYIADLKKQPACGIQEGFEATVLALKTNEAVLEGGRVELPKELFTLA